MTEHEVRQRLRAYVSRFPTQAAAARSLGIEPPVLNRMLNGHRYPSGRVLDAIGIERRPLGGAWPKPFRETMA